METDGENVKVPGALHTANMKELILGQVWLGGMQILKVPFECHLNASTKTSLLRTCTSQTSSTGPMAVRLGGGGAQTQKEKGKGERLSA